jgi:hypothetical protein
LASRIDSNSWTSLNSLQAHDIHTSESSSTSSRPLTPHYLSRISLKTIKTLENKLSEPNPVKPLLSMPGTCETTRKRRNPEAPVERKRPKLNLVQYGVSLAVYRGQDLIELYSKRRSSCDSIERPRTRRLFYQASLTGHRRQKLWKANQH